MKFLLLLLTFLTVSCSDKDINIDQDQENKTLEKLSAEISSIANESVCSGQYVCDFVGVGSKPCGGYRGYLVYSTSIDVTSFLKKVKKYNELENKYNIKYGIISDCMILMPPSGTTCKNGKCKIVY